MSFTMNKKYSIQIDIVKGLAIIAVVVLHALPLFFSRIIFSQFHITQSFAIFFVIIGITLTSSLGKHSLKHSLKIYFIRRFWRYIPAFIVMFFCSFLYLVYFHIPYTLNWLNLIGMFPVEGAGNYFISVLFEVILFGPLLYLWYKKSPVGMLIFTLIASFLFEFISPHIQMFAHNTFLYKANILRYLFAIGLGLYASDEYLKNHTINLKSRKNIFIFFLLPVSIIYLFIGGFILQPIPLFEAEWGTSNFIAYPYVFFITALLLNIKESIYKKIKLINILALLGKASYHIFLFQMVYFGYHLAFTKRIVTWNNYLTVGPVAVVSDVIISLFLGMLFYYGDKYSRILIANRI